MENKIFDTASHEVSVSCEFPMENLPYTIEAHKIGNQMMLCFTGRGEKWGDYFVISVRENNVHISTQGG